MKVSAQVTYAIFILLFIISAFFSHTTPVLTGAFQLKSIGALQTNGVLFDKWYYTGTQPTFYGEGLAGGVLPTILITSLGFSLLAASYLINTSHFCRRNLKI